MIKYTIKRLFMMIPVILGVMIIVFFFQSVSDVDPTIMLLGSGAKEEAREALRDELGLNDPIVVQFGRYVWNFFTKGDLGTSFKTKLPVTHELMVCFPVTLKLAFISVIVGVLLGIPLGAWSAVKQYSLADSSIVTFSVLVEAVPGFWLALLLISTFAVKLGWVPTSGLETWKGWILPSIVVSCGSVGTIIRVTRSSMLETIRQDYIRMAKAKGQTEMKIIMSHVLRNSMIPILAAIGNNLGIQLGGALVTESIFAMPGIGKYAVDAINSRNYPAVLGSVVILAITFSLVNLIIDLSYAYVDPKLRTTIENENKFKFLQRRKQHAAAGKEA